jgi:hypothetical protein
LPRDKATRDGLRGKVLGQEQAQVVEAARAEA